MVLDRLFNTKLGIILLSIVWGLGLSTLFNSSCKSRNCYIIRGPSVHETENKTFNYGTNKCYKYYPALVPCDGGES